MSVGRNTPLKRRVITDSLAELLWHGAHSGHSVLAGGEGRGGAIETS